MPTSLPPPSQGMATRRLQEEANILRRMARLHSPGLVAGTSSAERPHSYSSQQHGSMAAGPVMERQHYPQHFEEDGGQWDDDNDEDEDDGYADNNCDYDDDWTDDDDAKTTIPMMLIMMMK